MTPTCPPGREPSSRRAPRRLRLAGAELVVGTDGRATHDNPYAFHLIRVSWSQVVDEPERVRKLLCRRAHSLSIQSVQRSFE